MAAIFSTKQFYHLITLLRHCSRVTLLVLICAVAVGYFSFFFWLLYLLSFLTWVTS